ncbi:MAG: RNA polymerase sigma factor [Alistipes sp.]|nr:RNA polymerase sigma factor [Alistipes sp.]
MEELALVDRLKAGDREAQKELYDRFAGHLMSLCQRYMGGREEAEDLLHDSFLRVFKAVRGFEWRGEGSLRGWMDRVAVNLCIEHLRHRTAKGACEELLVGESADEPTIELLDCFSSAELFEEVCRLPEGYRTIFNLYYVEGLSHREIADLLGIKERSSSSQLARARASLARRLMDKKEQER